ncbi:hypothetical protein HDV00_007563 [Rhizophlyctis rosea]|nr:hypothetical protein HDV00_007563 [Rhizophlyctis rosea]
MVAETNSWLASAVPLAAQRQELHHYAIVEEDLLLAERLQIEEAIRASLGGSNPPSISSPAPHAGHVNELRGLTLLQQNELLNEFDFVVAERVGQAMTDEREVEALDWEFAKRLESLEVEEEDAEDDDNETCFDDIEAADVGLGGIYREWENHRLNVEEVLRQAQGALASDLPLLKMEKGKERATTSVHGSGPWSSAGDDKVDDVPPLIEDEDIIPTLISEIKCIICFDKVAPHTPASNSSTGILIYPSGCSHPFCAGCLNQYALKTHNGRLPAPCPQQNCSGTITLTLLQPHLPPNEFAQLDSKATEQSLVDQGKGLWCPNKSCSAFLVNEDMSGSGDRVPCPSCKEDLCLECVTVWHEGLTCEQYRRLPDDEQNVEDLKLRQLATQQSWRREWWN